MSDGGGGSRGNGSVVAAGIPAGSRKMVQSLKEIVNLPDQEIYATLKDCGMDPNEAVQRLLSQDSFQAVKSKREKKKEVKEVLESRNRPNNNASGRGVHSSSGRGLQPCLTTSNSNGFGGNHGKTLQKNDDEIYSITSLTNMGSNFDCNGRPTIIREKVSTENLFVGVTAISDGKSMHSQSSSGYQHGWIGMPGNFSMADIVKMGRPQGKLSRSCTDAGNVSNVSHQFRSDTSKPGAYSEAHVLPSELDKSTQSSQVPYHQAEENTFEQKAAGNNDISHDTWLSIIQSNPETTTAFLDTSASATYADISKPALVDNEIQHHNLHDETLEPVQSIESYSSLEHSIGSEPIYEGDIDEHTSEGGEVNVEISSVATNLQHMGLENDGLSGAILEENPAVIIPKHLQVTNAECSHLSFGSFCCGISTSLPGSLQPKPLHSSSEVIKVVDYVPPLDHTNARNSNYYDNDDTKSQTNEDAVSRGDMNTIIYETSSVSEPYVSQGDAMSSTHEHYYSLPSLSGYGTSITAPSSAAFSQTETNLQLHNLSSLSNPYTGPLPSNLLASTLPLRDLDLPFSSFLRTKSVSTKHCAAASDSASTIPMQEVKPGDFSNLQPQAPQSSPSSNIPTADAIPQHLPLQTYSHATLPPGQLANLIGYPYLPQSYTFMPSSAFPPAYTSNNPFYQSPSPVHSADIKYSSPQYKNNLPHPTAVVSGYGNFGGPNNIPLNFSLNPLSASSTQNYEFAQTSSAQYKEGTNYLPIQPNEGSPMWIHGGSSRTVSPLPSSTFYGFQGQNQPSSFRHAQQPSHYGQMGYLNLFQDQHGGQSQEQQQNTGEVNLNGSQGNSSQQSHQIWQHGY